MNTHLFNVNIAKEYGVHEAIMLYNLMFWQEKNEAENRHFYEERHWTYNSVKAFEKLFIYLSRSQVRRVLAKLENKGLILCGNFNKSGYDRTKWYSVTDVAKRKCICQGTQMDVPQNANRFDENGNPIPDSNTDISTDDKQSESDKNAISFISFWDLYDKKVSNADKCELKYNALEDDDKRAIMSYLPDYIEANPEKKFRKNPETFLNQKAWNFEIMKSKPKREFYRENVANLADNEVYYLSEDEAISKFEETQKPFYCLTKGLRGFNLTYEEYCERHVDLKPNSEYIFCYFYKRRNGDIDWDLITRAEFY